MAAGVAVPYARYAVQIMGVWATATAMNANTVIVEFFVATFVVVACVTATGDKIPLGELAVGTVLVRFKF